MKAGFLPNNISNKKCHFIYDTFILLPQYLLLSKKYKKEKKGMTQKMKNKKILIGRKYLSDYLSILYNYLMNY